MTKGSIFAVLILGRKLSSLLPITKYGTSLRFSIELSCTLFKTLSHIIVTINIVKTKYVPCKKKKKKANKTKACGTEC